MEVNCGRDERTKSSHSGPLSNVMSRTFTFLAWKNSKTIFLTYVAESSYSGASVGCVSLSFIYSTNPDF